MLGYPASAKGKSNPKPLLPFISQAPGWGVKSSRGLSYLGKSSPMIFKKSKSSTGYLGQECLPATNLLSVSKGLLLADNEGEGEAILSSEMALFISLGLFSNSTLLLERAYHDGKGENPNIVPKIVDYPFSIEELNDATKDDLFWVSGFLKEPSVIKPTSEVCFYKSSLARRLIIVG